MKSSHIEIKNDGPLIIGSNYWDTETARAGKIYLTINAGAFRLLLPDAKRSELPDMRRGAKHIVLSILSPDKWEDGKFCAEFMIEDGSTNPYAIHLSPAAIDRKPIADDVGKEWIATIWQRKNGRIHKALERPAYAQIVPSLPWLKKIS